MVEGNMSVGMENDLNLIPSNRIKTEIPDDSAAGLENIQYSVNVTNSNTGGHGFCDAEVKLEVIKEEETLTATEFAALFDKANNKANASSSNNVEMRNASSSNDVETGNASASNGDQIRYEGSLHVDQFRNANSSSSSNADQTQNVGSANDGHKQNASSSNVVELPDANSRNVIIRNEFSSNVVEIRNASSLNVVVTQNALSSNCKQTQNASSLNVVLAQNIKSSNFNQTGNTSSSNVEVRNASSTNCRETRKARSPKVDRTRNASSSNVKQTRNDNSSNVDQTRNARSSKVDRTRNVRSSKVDRTRNAKSSKVDRTRNARSSNVKHTWNDNSSNVDQTPDDSPSIDVEMLNTSVTNLSETQNASSSNDVEMHNASSSSVVETGNASTPIVEMQNTISSNVDQAGNANSSNVDPKQKAVQETKMKKKKRKGTLFKKSRAYSNEDMIKAYDAVRFKGVRLLDAAQNFNIPISTLCRKVNGVQPLHLKIRTTLSPDDEKMLVRWIIEREKRGCVVSPKIVLNEVQRFLCAEGRTTGFNNNKPSKMWFTRFKERHPELGRTKTSDHATSLTPRALAIVREESIRQWFREAQKAFLDEGLDITSLDPSRMFRCDETGFLLNLENTHILNLKEDKKVPPEGICQQITVLGCASASGVTLKPLIVHPNKSFSSDLQTQFPGCSFSSSSKKGLFESTIFHQWFAETFIPQTSHLPKPVVLFVDSHTIQHVSIEVHDLTVEHKIFYYSYPSNATYMIEPHELTFLKALKLDLRTHQESEIGIEDFARIFHDVWAQSYTKEQVKNSFEASGLYPWSEERPSYKKWIPSWESFCRLRTKSDSSPQHTTIPEALEDTSSPQHTTIPTALENFSSPRHTTIQLALEDTAISLRACPEGISGTGSSGSHHPIALSDSDPDSSSQDPPSSTFKETCLDKLLLLVNSWKQGRLFTMMRRKREGCLPKEDSDHTYREFSYLHDQLVPTQTAEAVPKSQY